MDLIGEAGPLADAELIAAAIDILRGFGLSSKDVQARISDRRVLRALLLGNGLTEAQLPIAFAAIDKAERDPMDVLERRLAEAGVGKREVGSVFEIAALRDWSAVKEALGKVKGGAEAGEPLEQSLGALKAMGLGDFVTVDLTIVRGLAYYTGTVFELFDAGRTLRAICGGGRYDGLLKALGGVDLPALGFGMGDVVLGELLKERSGRAIPSGAVQVFLVAIAGEDLPVVLELAHQLRDKGVGVEYALKQGNIRKQLELAAARGAARAVILGPDERASGVGVVRDLTAGTETKVPLTSIRNGSFQ
jgi:histidyl-tRNA synthetase